MKLRYVCLTVSERLKNVNAMKEQIPELEVFVDHNKSKFDFLLKVWDTLKNDDVIWLEDDVELCNNFKEKIENEIEFFGNKELINFFYAPINNMYDSSFFSKDSRSAYRDGKSFLWNQCVFIPKGFLNYFIYYYNNNFKNFNFFDPEKFNYDNCIAYSLDKMKQKYWLIRPSLVQHNSKNSVLGHSDNRVSIFFDKDGLFEKGYHFEYINVKFLIARLPRCKKDHSVIKELVETIKNVDPAKLTKHIYIDYNNINYQMLYACNTVGIKYIYVKCANKSDVLSLFTL